MVNILKIGNKKNITNFTGLYVDQVEIRFIKSLVLGTEQVLSAHQSSSADREGRSLCSSPVRWVGRTCARIFNLNRKASGRNTGQ